MRQAYFKSRERASGYLVNGMSVSGERGTKGLMSEFFQDPPRLGNQYDDDALLRAYLRWRLPPKMLAEIEPDLRRLGNCAATAILAFGESSGASPSRPVADDALGPRGEP